MSVWFQGITIPQNVSGPVLTTYVLFDIFLIVVLARVLGSVIARIGQPRVVGEILAGILLGPTLLGSLSMVIIPTEARPALSSIATMALGMFMFTAGVEFDLSKVRGKEQQASLLAVTAVLIPVIFGFPIAKFLYSPAYTGETTNLLPFALFIGAALSVTAFPVMVHILMERGELNTRLGSLGVATTGIMSVLMFSFIAFATALAASTGYKSLLLRISLTVTFALVSWFLVRPVLARWLHGDQVSGDGMAVCFGGLVLYSVIGHVLGINALVGGFLWGTLLPANRALRANISARVKDIAMILFLPVFFAMAGLQTDLKLITVHTLPAIGLMLAGAIGGKFLSALPSRFFGFSWNETGILGALFNTRGLLVLVVGLLGLEFKIITNLMFTIMVIMALVTNLMTIPLYNLLSSSQHRSLVSQGSAILDVEVRKAGD